MERAFNLVAGDLVTWVSPAGTQTELLTIQKDVTPSDVQHEGVEIDQAGLLSHGYRKLDFLKSYLAEKSVTLDPTGYFLIGGSRWDFAKGEPVQEATNPLGGLHHTVTVWVRKAVEGEASGEGSEWGFGGLPQPDP
jgi:hypothetical protein